MKHLIHSKRSKRRLAYTRLSLDAIKAAMDDGVQWHKRELGKKSVLYTGHTFLMGNALDQFIKYVNLPLDPESIRNIYKNKLTSLLRSHQKETPK